MPPVGFEPMISAGERPYIHALDRAATGTGKVYHLQIQNTNQYARHGKGCFQGLASSILLPEFPSFNHGSHSSQDGLNWRSMVQPNQPNNPFTSGLAPWVREFLEKLTVPKLVKFSAVYRT